jgi:hypothetical protein
VSKEDKVRWGRASRQRSDRHVFWQAKRSRQRRWGIKGVRYKFVYRAGRNRQASTVIKTGRGTSGEGGRAWQAVGERQDNVGWQGNRGQGEETGYVKAGQDRPSEAGTAGRSIHARQGKAGMLVGMLCVGEKKTTSPAGQGRKAG